MSDYEKLAKPETQKANDYAPAVAKALNTKHTGRTTTRGEDGSARHI
jgi:hypothetical protein